MRSKAKAQIYSVNENLPVDQVARMWGILDQLERTRRKERKVAKSPKIKLQVKSRFVDWSCDNLLQKLGVHIYSLD